MGRFDFTRQVENIMAESERARKKDESERARKKAESERARKRLNDDNLRLVKLKREAIDWRGNVSRGAAPRGVLRGSGLKSGEMYGDPFKDMSYAKDATRSEAKLPEATEKELGLMNLCSKMKDSKEFFNKVKEAIASLPNCDMTALDWNLFGNKYIQGRYVEYLIGFYGVGNETKIDLKRMSGDGFAMAAFFTEVKNQLKKGDLIVETEEDSVEFAYSEDDDDDSGDDEDNLGDGYLQLAYDPNIVLAWIKKIQTRHLEDQLHMLGLMAYNASNKQNLDIIVKKGGKKLKALFINKYENSNVAALVRFTSELAKYVTGHDDCKNHGYDKEFLVATLDAMKFWCPDKPASLSEKNRQQSTKFEVTESKETVMNLVQTIYNLGETMKIYPEETIKNIAKERLDKKKYKKSSPKDDIVAFLGTQKLTKPVEYFQHILNEL